MTQDYRESLAGTRHDALQAAIATATAAQSEAMRPRTRGEAMEIERRARETAEQLRRETAVAAERTARARLARLRAAGVPKKHLDVLLGPWDATRYTARVVAAWRKTRHCTLVLGGAKGTGKSGAACWLVDQGPRRQYLTEDGFYATEWPEELRPRYVHSAKLARLSTYYRAGAVSELDVLERCAMLVIDEVGGVDVGRASDWIARLDSITAVRADNELDTIITTNMRVDDEEEERDGRRTGRVIPGFRSIYGERLLDRMRGDGKCWVEFSGGSFRASEAWDVEAAVQQLISEQEGTRA